MDNYNYPMGADNANAPWNKQDPEDIYGDEAVKRIDEEMGERGSCFDEWLNENGYLPDPDDVDDVTYDRIIELFADDATVRRKYHEYRMESVIEDLQQEAAERDYD